MNTKKTIIFIALAIAVISITAYLIRQNRPPELPPTMSEITPDRDRALDMEESDAEETSQEETSAQNGTSPEIGTTVVRFTNAGFQPANIEIQSGDTVVWQNDSNIEMWPASGPHPTHTGYPGSNINKCDTAQESEIFDACRPIAPGGSYSFTFYEPGIWAYHDHLNVARTGRVDVRR